MRIHLSSYCACQWRMWASGSNYFCSWSCSNPSKRKNWRPIIVIPRTESSTQSPTSSSIDSHIRSLSYMANHWSTNSTASRHFRTQISCFMLHDWKATLTHESMSLFSRRQLFSLGTSAPVYSTGWSGADHTLNWSKSLWRTSRMRRCTWMSTC